MENNVEKVGQAVRDTYAFNLCKVTLLIKLHANQTLVLCLAGTSISQHWVLA